MKLATFRDDGTRRIGVVDVPGGTLRPLAFEDGLAEQGVLAAVAYAAHGLALPEAGDPLPLAAMALEAPVPKPRRNIFCVGKNYHDHAHEFAGSGFDSSAAAGAVPEAPIVFSKVPESVTGPGAPILIDPAVSTAVDYEVELTVIIGRGGRNIAPEAALDHIWGYTIVNDVTARDIQGRHKQWLLGKSLDSYCPMGPWAVTRDEVDLSDTAVRTWVNGELRQEANTGQLIFDVPTIIATVSRGITLLPGDLIATGTPAGVGIGFTPPRYLKAGDLVRMEITGIGVLENPVVEHVAALEVPQ